jgi:hypothetical protein
MTVPTRPIPDTSDPARLTVEKGEDLFLFVTTFVGDRFRTQAYRWEGSPEIWWAPVGLPQAGSSLDQALQYALWHVEESWSTSETGSG